jgi:hypothetical protein
MLGISACTKRKSQPPEGDKKQEQGDKSDDKKEKMDTKQGQNVAEDYMRALILRDENKIKNLYSASMKQRTTSLTPAQNPHPNGYMVDTFEEKEGVLSGKARIFSVTTGEPYFSADESTITIIKEKGMYVIDKVEKSKSLEITEKDRVLWTKEDGDIKGKETLKLDEVPRYGTPQGTSPDQKFPIGRDKFGPIAMDAEGKMLAVTTVGTNPAILLVDIEKKKATPLDIFFNGSAQSIVWSQDAKFLAVEMSNPQGARFLNVYDVEKEKKVDDPMKDALKSSKYSINTPYWSSKNELIFNVSGASQLTPDEQKQTGSYKFDVKNMNLTKF